MPRLRIRDGAGNILVDESVRTGRRASEIAITAPTGSFSVAGLSEGEPWDVFATGSIGGAPVVSYAGDNGSWTWEGDFVPGTLMVGVY
ncbi:MULTISPECIES: hypothetical protein [unclassified Sphingobium]|uniref:hypothetical protein n=1 Tax=unclassified Sphingobium TaxID=2611147 RepID=UPI00222498E2|nr:MULTISPECIES: hypothetical protein [unclassified Sphingobium]MCW2395896.1 hypothetical protein [Sphingobium sp. B8D3B]MCW2419412.1 hypothetical protein [Sphingobium sp. B8D3C]